MSRIGGPGWPDQRGWMAIGLYALTVWITWLARPVAGAEPSEFFKTLATGVVITGFLNGVVSHLFTSSKASADVRAQADKALDIARNAISKDTPAA